MPRSPITIEQAKALREQAGERLQWLNRLVERMESLRFLPDDPLLIAARHAQDGMHHLFTASHYASCESGVGQAHEKAPDLPGQ